jgi:outer membrane protein OmpA-like peptidoglycan-associated protein
MVLLSGCATKKFVRQEVGVVNQQVSDVSGQTRENAERIDAVDRRAGQGITDAATARTAAQAADTRAGQAQTAATAAQTTASGAQQSATTANQGVQAANTRIATVETRVTSINSTINSLDQYSAGQTQVVLFKVGSSTLDDSAKAALDTVAGELSGLKSGYLIEVQGFASAEGSESGNLKLSQSRADAVQRYLVSKNVPLYRVRMLGLGEESPVADNKTRNGREQNRRVEVRVLRAVSAAAGGNN